MDQQLQQLLQVSAQIYEKLTNNPEDSKREAFIGELDDMLESRGNLVQQLVQAGFLYDEGSKAHRTLRELDKGIRNRLDGVMQTIKDDMKDLQKSKQNEQQYTNPYGHVQVMDGMYYDKKK